MKILSLEEIKKRIDLQKIISMQEEGFKAYSNGEVIVPPVGHMHFDDPQADYHIKYGYIKGDELFVVKMGGIFYENMIRFNLPNLQAVMLVIDIKTGKLHYLLNDEGYLTNMRTSIAGLIAAKYLGPKQVGAIGILGTGNQARMQLSLLKDYTSCCKVYLWGRNLESAKQCKDDMVQDGFDVVIAETPKIVAQNCNLIVTTTSAEKPLLMANDIQPGTHITAMGADRPGKQELDPYIFFKADRCITDSKSQCIEHGDSHHAIKNGCISEVDLIELGEVIAKPELGRSNEQQITIADLTGVAIQDIQIAKSIISM